MDYDRNKVDEMVLALLSLTMMKDGSGVRAWKGHDWEALDRLHTAGERRGALHTVFLLERFADGLHTVAGCCL